MTKLTVWYDGSCPLCKREISALRKLDTTRAINFIDVTTAGPGAYPISRDELRARFNASDDGVLLSGAAACAAMWRAVPTLRPLGQFARIPPVLGILEGAYRVFLVVRPFLQRLAIRVGLT
jgi:predicted DCC family thiol-disulfide oxidoreductase YuxK